MTEQEWLACADPMPMLEYLGEKASDRKSRLFCCACCRRIWHLVKDDRSKKAVEIGEGLVDGLVTLNQLDTAERRSTKAETEAGKSGSAAPYYAALAARNCIASFPDAKFVSNYASAAVAAAEDAGSPNEGKEPFSPKASCLKSLEQVAHCELLRCIFGPLPFRSIALDPAWHTPEVRAFAKTIYADRTFFHLPALADALKEAGCTNEEIMTHCRGPGPHVRGCWCLDLILDKK